MALIVVGMMFVLVFVSATGSFKDLMVREITDSYLGHLQIHRKGYLEAIDSMPLLLNLPSSQVEDLRAILSKNPGIKAFSERLKFGAAFSNFEQTTNIRLNGVDPVQEFQTCPLLLSRIVQGGQSSLERGKILVPELLAQGLSLKVGDTAVVVATNKDGSVNGKTFVVGGILASATGPGGRDGYVHIEDARELLRMSDSEVSEIAIAVQDFDRLDRVYAQLQADVSAQSENNRNLSIDTWKKLSPFASVANMIDVIIIFMKLMLVSVVLISIMNVMVMAVYERIREIGTIAAIGTLPRKILSLFMVEGFLLGVLGSFLGALLSTGIILILNFRKITFAFGQQAAVVLAPTISPAEILLTSTLVVGVALLASLQPAWKASRMEPIQALRHV